MWESLNWNRWVHCIICTAFDISTMKLIFSYVHFNFSLICCHEITKAKSAFFFPSKNWYREPVWCKPSTLVPTIYYFCETMQILWCLHFFSSFFFSFSFLCDAFPSKKKKNWTSHKSISGTLYCGKKKKKERNFYQTKKKKLKL